MGVGVEPHALADLAPEKWRVSHFTVGWVGHRAGLQGCSFDPRTVNPLTSHYTCYTFGWNTLLQAGSSLVRYPMGSFGFFNWINLSGRTMNLGPLSL